MDNFWLVMSLVFGLLIGSFLNVLIYRIPRGENIVFPRSHCPRCNKIISWYENIPVISFLFLRGRCADCCARISWRYPVVELLTMFGAWLAYSGYLADGTIWRFVFLFSVFCIFLVHAFIDYDFKILPDSLTGALTLIFLVQVYYSSSWVDALVGAVLGIGLPGLVTWVFYLLRGQIGLGGGDIKLYGALGLLLGPMGVLTNIFLSCFLGSVVGIFLIGLKKMTRENPIPFGPFIILVGFLQIFFSELFRPIFY